MAETFNTAAYPILKEAKFSLVENGIYSHLAVCRYLDSRPLKMVSKKCDIYRHFAPTVGVRAEDTDLMTRIGKILDDLEMKKVVTQKKVLISPTIQKIEVKLNPENYGNFLMVASRAIRQEPPRTYADAQIVLQFLSKHHIIKDIEEVKGRVIFIVQYCWKDYIKSYEETMELLKAKGMKEISPELHIAICAALHEAQRALYKDPRTEAASKKYLAKVLTSTPTSETLAHTIQEKNRDQLFQNIDKKQSDLHYVRAFFKVVKSLAVVETFAEFVDETKKLTPDVLENIKRVLDYWNTQGKVMGSAETKQYFANTEKISNIEQAIRYSRVSLMRAAMFLKGKTFQYAMGREKARERYIELLRDGFIIREQSLQVKKEEEQQVKQNIKEQTKLQNKKEEHHRWSTKSPFDVAGATDVEYVVNVIQALPNEVLSKKLKREAVVRKELIKEIINNWKVGDKIYIPTTKNRNTKVSNSIQSAIKYILLKKYGLKKVSFEGSHQKTTTVHRLEKIEKHYAKFMGKRTGEKFKKREAEAEQKQTNLGRYIVMNNKGIILKTASDIPEINDLLKQDKTLKIYRECRIKTVFEVEDI